MCAEVEAWQGRPWHVLHVDDDPMNLRVVHDILQAFGHVAYGAGSGEEGLEQLGARCFDLVLMDIHMPGLGGIEVVQRLRASVGPERKVPVIALTANSLTRTREDYQRLGFQDLVTKPILVSKLYETLVRVMNAAHEAGGLEPQARFG